MEPCINCKKRPQKTKKRGYCQICDRSYLYHIGTKEKRGREKVEIEIMGNPHERPHEKSFPTKKGTWEMTIQIGEELDNFIQKTGYSVIIHPKKSKGFKWVNRYKLILFKSNT